MAFGVPALVGLIPVAWWSVTRGLAPRSDAEEAHAEVRRQRAVLGAITAPETRAAIVFGIVALCWVARVPVQAATSEAGIGWIGRVSDMGIAVAGAIAMFLVPAGGAARRTLLTWEEAVKLPWGVLVLFGGGISLGQAVTRTGLSAWIGDQLAALSTLPPIVFVAAVVLLVIFLTELTSNVATMTTLSPILGALATAIGAAPESLLGPAAVAASCAFMLPVATAPNAIIYATDRVPVSAMMRAGVRVNIIGAAIITVVGYFIAPLVL
ncbi:MAG: SLC13 family permease [Pseudomonadota bacterium]